MFTQHQLSPHRGLLTEAPDFPRRPQLPGEGRTASTAGSWPFPASDQAKGQSVPVVLDSDGGDGSR